MTDPSAAKMHSTHAGAAEMPTTTEVATTKVGAAAKMASAAAAEVAASAAAPSGSRVSRSSQNGREKNKNNGESFYPGHGTLERPPRVSNERGSVDYQ
jgi:hypothetical protein